MIIVGIIFGAFNGRMPQMTNAALDSAKEAVTLCITMTGVMSFWVGMMEIATRAGLVEMAADKLRPFLRFLFPRIPEGHAAFEHIATNCIANVLGLGWAATPAGLRAMEELSKLEEERRNAAGAWQGARQGERFGRNRQQAGRGGGNGRGGNMGTRRMAMPRGVASNEMCTFLILNISSLQLIPVNIIAYRGQYGSVNPTAIVGPAIMATAVSTVVAIVYCKVMDGKRGA
jgi:spore maturation protein A